MRDPTQGLPEVEVDGVVFRRGGRVVVRPGLDADLQARMLEGRTVTVERIQRDYDGRVHLGVALDEPGQEILRETGRFLWFFPPSGGGARRCEHERSVGIKSRQDEAN